MKFLYEYRTSDNAKHNGVIRAADREAAYALLKTKGIKPSRFAEAPGFFNKLFGKGKRWLAIGCLAVALVIALFYLAAKPEAGAIPYSIDDMTRRQVIGDALEIEKGIRTGWAAVFPDEGERFLASFAIPGVPAGQRNTTEAEINAALSRRVELKDSDGIEARQIKAMVEGMKRELREYLAAGGNIVEFGKRLVQRQEEEIGYYQRVKNEIEAAGKSGKANAQLESLWEDRNAKLRKMGIKLVPMPE